MQKRTQLNENITKLELAIENETRRAREFLGKKKAIEAQIYNEKVNAVAKKIGRKYEDFLDSYKYCRKTFYELGDDIQEAYNLDKKFYTRLHLKQSALFGTLLDFIGNLNS